MKNYKKISILLTLALALSLGAITGCSDNKASSSASSAASESSESSSADNSNIAQITVYVDPSGAGEAAKNYFFDTFTEPKQYDMTQGESAFLALYNTGVNIDGTPDEIYSINGLGQNANGEGTGWLFKVNGQTQTGAPKDCILQPNDELVFYYGKTQ